MKKSNNNWVVVLAAGDGDRLRSVTTNDMGDAVPKQFCSLRGGPSLLLETLERSESVAARDHICVVVASQHRRWWRAMLSRTPSANVIVQPMNRGTANGILLPLLHIKARDPDARIMILPSDHYVRDVPVLVAAMESALGHAGLSRGLRRGPVEENSLSSFAAGYPVSVVSGVPPKFDGQEVARRARSRIGENNYRILTNNCEHFCEWCLRGQPRSYQIDACLAIPSRALHVTRRLIADLLSLAGLGVQTKSKVPFSNSGNPAQWTEIDAGAVAATAWQCVSHRRERVRD